MIYPIRRTAMVVVLLAGTALVGACKTTNHDVGQLAGAAVGAIIGSRIGDGVSRLVATAIGGAVGAWIGGELGALLDEQEERRLAESTASSAITGQSSTWTNPKNGTRIETRVRKSQIHTQAVQVAVKKDRVEKIPPFELVGQQFRVKKNSNVRGGPSTEYAIVDRLSSGSTVDVLGEVEGKNWYILAENGVANGFIYKSLLDEVDNGEPVLLASTISGTDSNIELVTTSATTVCRDIEQVVALKDGTEKTEIVRACQGADGSWAVKSVA